MGRKPKFRPVITRIKLNPEQAVLTCDCFSMRGRHVSQGTGYARIGSGAHSVCNSDRTLNAYWYGARRDSWRIATDSSSS